MQTMIKHPVRNVVLVFLVASVTACGGGEDPPDAGASTDGAAPAVTAAGDLSADELEYGIGPIRNLVLGEVDPTLATSGEDVYSVKCAACHKLDERYVGPALRDVTERRTPEFVMNMILNPEEMVARHPEVKQLLAQYYTPMPNQQLTEQDARAVLEYLRQVGAEDPGAQN